MSHAKAVYIWFSIFYLHGWYMYSVGLLLTLKSHEWVGRETYEGMDDR